MSYRKTDGLPSASRDLRRQRPYTPSVPFLAQNFFKEWRQRECMTGEDRIGRQCSETGLEEPDFITTPLQGADDDIFFFVCIITVPSNTMATPPRARKRRFHTCPIGATEVIKFCCPIVSASSPRLLALLLDSYKADTSHLDRDSVFVPICVFQRRIVGNKYELVLFVSLGSHLINIVDKSLIDSACAARSRIVT